MNKQDGEPQTGEMGGLRNAERPAQNKQDGKPQMGEIGHGPTQRRKGRPEQSTTTDPTKEKRAAGPTQGGMVQPTGTRHQRRHKRMTRDPGRVGGCTR
jgi:hypothetical protein